MPTAAKPLMTIHGHIAGKAQMTDDTDQWSVTFQPDYQHQDNATWARNTPAMAMELNVRDTVAARLEPGSAVTITVTPA